LVVALEVGFWFDFKGLDARFGLFYIRYAGWSGWWLASSIFLHSIRRVLIY